MFLVVCATEFEMQALRESLSPDQAEWIALVTGVGMVETALNMGIFLERYGKKDSIRGVLNFGVGGAYLLEPGDKAVLMDVCLAEAELFGDFGICYPDRMEPLAEHLVQRAVYELDSELLDRAESLLNKEKIIVKRGLFLTVCGVSGTKKRGDILCSHYKGICENMEGAAVARVCEAFGLPFLEMRTISNYVEDRDLSRWKLPEACKQAGKAAAILLRGLSKE